MIKLSNVSKIAFLQRTQIHSVMLHTNDQVNRKERAAGAQKLGFPLSDTSVS